MQDKLSLLTVQNFTKKSLVELASTLSVEEKLAMKELTTNFLNQHYFSTVWPSLNSQKKEKTLEIVSKGKSIIPYKMILDMQSFFVTPEKDFWEKIEFYSDLKQSAVNDNHYENSKYLYHNIKNETFGSFK